MRILSSQNTKSDDEEMGGTHFINTTPTKMKRLTFGFVLIQNRIHYATT